MFLIKKPIHRYHAWQRTPIGMSCVFSCDSIAILNRWCESNIETYGELMLVNCCLAVLVEDAFYEPQ